VHERLTNNRPCSIAAQRSGTSGSWMRVYFTDSAQDGVLFLADCFALRQICCARQLNKNSLSGLVILRMGGESGCASQCFPNAVLTNHGQGRRSRGRDTLPAFRRVCRFHEYRFPLHILRRLGADGNRRSLPCKIFESCAVALTWPWRLLPLASNFVAPLCYRRPCGALGRVVRGHHSRPCRAYVMASSRSGSVT